MPVFCGVFGMAVFASLGLPGLSGFVGEFLIFNGAFASRPAQRLVSVLGLLLTAVFLLRMMRKVFHGPLSVLTEVAGPLARRTWLVRLPVLLIVAYGVLPQDLLLHFANPGIVELLDLLRPLP
jgi:NADH-quinone oxidoreductase subunit M